MLASSKTMDTLKAIGLNLYERNIWVALLSRGVSTAGELADISNVPRSRCYDVLESLAEKGFVLLQPGKPMKYVAIPPKEAFERAKGIIEEKANVMKNRIDTTKQSNVTKELEKIYKEGISIVNPEEMTATIKGRHKFYKQFGSMLKHAKKSVNIITTPKGLEDIADKFEPHMKKLSNKGVKIKIAAQIKKDHMELVKHLRKYADIRSIEGVEEVKNLYGRVAMVDGSEVLMALTHDEKVHPSQDIAFWSQSPHIASSVVGPMFNMVWNKSKIVK